MGCGIVAVMNGPSVEAIAAIGRNRELGKGNELLWRIPEDLKRFKELTMGHPVILGRKTFESIVAHLGKPLPGRTNIVVTRAPDWAHEGVMRANSVEEAVEMGKRIDAERVFIGGGAQIYEAALPYTDVLRLTVIDDTQDADTFFPEYEKVFTEVLSDEAGESSGIQYKWIDLARK